MAKNERKRTMVYSNVNKKKKAEKNSASKDNDVIDLDNEIVIGLARFPEPKEVVKNSKKKKAEKSNSGSQMKNTKPKNKKSIKSNKKEKNDDINNIEDLNKLSDIENMEDIEDIEDIEYTQINEGKNKKSTKKDSDNIKIKNKEIVVKSSIPKEKAMPIKQKIKMQKRRAIRRMATCFLLLMFLVGGSIYLLLSPVFNVKTIQVINNSTLTQEQIINLSGIKLNENIFKFSKKDSKKSILSNPYVEGVEINRQLFKNQVEVTVKERVATLMLEYGNSYVYINNQGYILEISTIKLDTPILRGYITPLEDVKPGNRLIKGDLERLETVLKIMEIARTNNIEKLITQIDITSKKDYKLIFEGEGKTAYLGDCSQLSTQMLYIQEILKRNEGIDGEIFVNMDLNEKDPVFRWKV